MSKASLVTKDDTAAEEEKPSETNVAREESRMPCSSVTSLAISLAMKIITVGFVWTWGYMNYSVGWLLPPMALAVWKTESGRYNELKRMITQATALAGEKRSIMSRLDELPSWVYFPDFDRAEWLNRILYKVWPGMNHFVRGIFKETIEPSIFQALSEYKLKGFKFERLVLGRIPPKIYGIKVYENNTSRNEIILDCDILYAGDCDISFSVGNLRGGIRDFQIRGLIRVVMKPMLNVIPFIGGMQIFFLNTPSIDYNLVGAVDILDLPGFSQSLRNVINEQVAAIMVLPNKLVVPLTEDVPSEVLKMPEPEGVLRIHIVQAKHLMKKDIGVLGKGKSDPYAVITVGAQEFRTKTIDNTVDPKWDYWCECVVSSAIAQQTTISVWDHDDTKGDESLGRATIEVSRVKKKGIVDTWSTLEFAKHGMVQLRLTWLNLSKNPRDLQAAIVETQQLRVTSMSTGCLILYVDSAKNLPCLRGSKQPDVYLEASIGSKTERTSTILRSCNPIWEQGFTFLIGNPETASLNIKIWDVKTGMVIGTLMYNLATLLGKKDMEDMQQPYDLQNAGPDSKLVLSMSLRILKYEKPEPTSDEDEDDHGINELNKKIERQESTASNSLPNTVSSTPLRKQPSKESVHSAALTSIGGGVTTIPQESSSGDNIEEETIVCSISEATHTGLVHRNLSQTSSLGEAKLGRIQLTLRYSMPRQKLVVVVHKLANLPLPQNDPHNVPDPYVKLYLLPDRHKETKRKTAIMKDNVNPIYDEQFEYVVSQGDLNTRILAISVCTQKGWLSSGSNVIGQIYLNLSEMDVTHATTSWYDLMPEIKD